MRSRTKIATGWYLAAETKRPRIMHLGSHARLGSAFAKCGKLLGRVVSDTNGYDQCLNCVNEKIKSDERQAKMVAIVASEVSMSIAGNGMEARLLERNVLRLAKAWRNRKSMISLSEYRELTKAIDELIEFERPE